MNRERCPFCEIPPDQVFLERELVVGLWDAHAVAPGHALLVPRRHVTDWFAAEKHEQVALLDAIPAARDAMHKEHRPDAFNIEINVGEVAGETVSHLHVHLIPSYRGDVPDPSEGGRWVLPRHARRRLGRATGTLFSALARSEGERLITGGDDPLLPHLLKDLDEAIQVDIAVAFVLESGVRRLEEHLRDLLLRGGKIRLVTGDYLDVTDPCALLRLMDLAGHGDDGALELYAFETAGSTNYHPKAYILRKEYGTDRAYVGSSNLTQSALAGGVEWNYRVVPSEETEGFAEISQAFEDLLRQPSVRPIDWDWVESYRRRRRSTAPTPVAVPPEQPAPVPEPHEIQQKALTALEETRAEGNSAGLVVLATGLGKTWLSAFDSNRPEYQRILFVAHREEILSQAKKTFRLIRPTAQLGHYTGKEKVLDADVLFASIQTLGKLRHLQSFDRRHFDYIVVDEFHHAAARTYRGLIEFFEPKFLLALTATPERTDGGDLLSLCGENTVYRCGLAEGIKLRLLSPFHYFGVPDGVDYSNIPWRSSRFDEEELTQAVATRARAQNAFEQFESRAGKRVLGFCCSQGHADFMAGFFRDQGVKAVAVHAGDSSAARASSLEQLNDGELEIIFAVDMFNEGVDLPNIDTVMMLRPTESRLLWLQQFGRGLRRAEGKERLTVIDYIGNHRTFLLKPQALFDLPEGDQRIRLVLQQAAKHALALPPGCEVTYDLEAINILEALLRDPKKHDALRMYYEEFRERHDVRPRAVEAFHDGYSPGTLRKSHGSWLAFVDFMQDLSAEQAAALREHGAFLESLETTPMTTSFKMLALLAALNLDGFPGEADVQALAEEFKRLARRSAKLREDVGPSLEGAEGLPALEAWTAGEGAKGRPYFALREAKFATTFGVEPEHREALQELTRELAEWRLAKYLSSTAVGEVGQEGFVCNVSHSGGRPILRLPDRASHPAIPRGLTPVLVDGEEYQADFVKVAVNVMRRRDSDQNELAAVMRRWFGSDAGLPGTRHRVVFRQDEDRYVLEPTGATRVGEKLELWHRYAREEIPRLFDLEFHASRWNQGFVRAPGSLFLLVTLKKQQMVEAHQYEDRFVSPTEFQWQSQNRTTQASKDGQNLRGHAEREIRVHLFVRAEKKINNRAAPFHYCGIVDFVSWRGEKPITIQWALQEPVPERLREPFGLSP